MVLCKRVAVPFLTRLPLSRNTGTSVLSLPDEVLRMVFDHFALAIASPSHMANHNQSSLQSFHIVSRGDRVVLLSLMLVCRRFRACATPILYRHLVFLKPQLAGGWYQSFDFSTRLLQSFALHSDSGAFACARTLSIRYQSVDVSDPAPHSFRRLLAACPNVRMLHIEGPALAEILKPDQRTGKRIAPQGLEHLIVSTVGASKLPGLLATYLYRGSLLSLSLSSSPRLQIGSPWPRLEQLALLASCGFEARHWHLDFSGMPRLRRLLLHDACVTNSPAAAALLNAGVLTSVQEIEIAVGTVDGVRDVTQAFASLAHCISRVEILRLDLGNLHSRLYGRANVAGAARLVNLARELEMVSREMSFRLLPDTLVLQAELCLRSLNGTPD